MLANASPNVFQLVRRGESYLVTSGVPNARCNAEWILSHVLGCDSSRLYLTSDQALTADHVATYHGLLERRAAREPLQYILGTTEFMSLPFLVSPGVFVPRPDTELLVEKTEPHLEPGHILADLCCGSGIIAVSLLARVSRTRAIAVDVAPAATQLTARNAKLNHVDDRLECQCQDAIAYLAGSRIAFDAIVCNPPYVRSGDLGELAPEIREHEPLGGLDGGEDGLVFYRDIIGLVARSLRPGGTAGFEIGSTQGAAVAELFARASLVDIAVHRDYAGLERVVTARRA